MNFKLRQLEGFVCAARHASFSKAAREMAMTQPAFSQLIRELEHHLNVRLFERTTRSVALTDAGRRFLALVERPLDDLGDAHAVIRDIAAGRRGRIVLAALPSVAFGFATAGLARFKSRYPSTSVRLIEAHNSNIIEKVLSREVDFGIGTLAARDAELAFEPLLEDELVAVFPAGHRFARRATVTWKELGSEHLVLLPPESSVREISDVRLTGASADAEPIYEVAGMLTALGMVRAGLGVSVLPLIALAGFNTRGLASSRITSPRPLRQIGIVRRADRQLSPAAAAYVEMLKEKGVTGDE